MQAIANIHLYVKLVSVVLHILMKGRAFTLGALGSGTNQCELMEFIAGLKQQDCREHDRLLARLKHATDK